MVLCWEAFVAKAKAKAKKKTTGARAKRDRRRKLATEAPASAEELLASVPGLDALQDVPAFDDLPVDAAQQAAFDDFCAQAEEPEQMQLGAVVRLDRGFPLVATADDTFRAEHAVGFAKSRGEDEVLLPAVGDRVAVRRAPGHDMGVIECVLPRRTSFERWRGRARGEHQVLCSNVDSVLIVQALGAGEVLLDRVARSLVLALDCDAEPVVVLTKADRCEADELERDLDRVRRLVGPVVRVIVTSSAEGLGLDEVRACVPAGSCAMILGESGAGKSTLLKSLNRMNDLVPDVRHQGDIRIDGTSLYDPRVEVISLRKRVGMVFQKYNPFPKSIYENIVFPLRVAGRNRRAELDETVERSLKGAALWDEVKDKLHESAYGLSGGQQHRLCIARAIANRPQILLMDEPCAALDPIATLKIEDLMEDLKKELTIVIVTHNMQQATRIADRTAFMYMGRLVEYGETSQIFTNPTEKETEAYITGRFS